MELSLNQLQTKNRKHRRRVGRGSGSGRGTYSGRGMKGQKSRSGANIRPGFEGGRMPLIRQIPKSRGFTSRHPKSTVVNIGDLEKLFANNEQVTAAKMVDKGLLKKASQSVKILGNGELKKSLTVEADAFSKSAKDAITKAGGAIRIRRSL